LQTRPHAIIAASDARCGDFLVQHWLRSLVDNVDLGKIDVVVLDFGLTEAQRAALLGRAQVVPAGGHPRVNVARRAAISTFLAEHDYDQVLVVDAGDIVFQGDVSPLFEQDRDSFRAVPERYPIPLPLFLRGSPPDLRRRILAQLETRPMINVGFILGPAKRVQELGRAGLEHASRVKHDQPLLSCLLHEQGFVELDPTYNFVPWTVRERFRIEDGAFLRASGERIAVVHNTGLRAQFRVIADFGYGRGYNTRIRRRHLWLAAVYERVATVTFEREGA
jgi:hypothetical protein